nr:MAG: RNA-dependent RNA polymerase [Jingmen shrew picorna-like virus 1]
MMSTLKNTIQDLSPKVLDKVSNHFKGDDGRLDFNTMLRITNELLHSVKLPATAAAIKVFRESNDILIQSSALYAAFSVVLEDPPLNYFLKFANSFQDIKSMFKLFDKPEELQVTEQEEVLPEFQADEPAIAVEFDATQGSSSFTKAFENLPSAGEFLSVNSTIIRAICGFLSCICAVLGVDKLLATIKSDLPQKIVNLSKEIVSVKNIWTSLTAIVDKFLPILYSMFGVEYVDPTHMKITTIRKAISEAHSELVEAQRRFKSNFFSITLENTQTMKKRYDELYKRVDVLTENEKSMYNFHNKISELHAGLAEINNILVNMQKSSCGKQRPVSIWIAGDAGVGKTRISTFISAQLAARHNGSVYQRTNTDEYWSSYYNQTVCVFDDLMQRTSGVDVEDFHKYTSQDHKDVIGAAIHEKGIPFTSKYIVVTSNQTWIAPPTTMKEYLALNRRRDLLVYMHFPAMQEYKSTHGGMDPVDKQWYEENKPEYYLCDPTFGFRPDFEDHMANRQFRPSERWVLMKTSPDELVEFAWNLQQYRAEEYRLTILAQMGENAPDVPLLPFEYDKNRIFQVATECGIAPVDDDVLSNASSEKESDLEKLPLVFKTSDEAEIMTYINSLLDIPIVVQSMKDLLTVKLIKKPMILMFTNGVLFKELGSSSSYKLTAIDDFFQRDKYKIIFDHAPVLNVVSSNGIFTRVDMYVHDEGVAKQSNPARTEVVMCKTPAILIRGPPGVGKSQAVRSIPLHYEVKYAEGEVYPEGKILLFDDVSIARERVDIMMKYLSLYYDGKVDMLPVITLNDKTAVWKNLQADERSLIYRRCHLISIDYSRLCKGLATFQRKDTSVYIRSLSKNFEDNLNFKFDIFPNRDPAFLALKPCFDALRQIINIEARSAATQNSAYHYECLVCPPPKNIDLEIVLDDDENPDMAKIKTLIKGKQANLVQMTSLGAIFLKMKSLFNTATLADRMEAPALMNSKRVRNPTKYRDILVRAPSWAIGLTTVDGIFFCYLIDERLPYDLRTFPDLNTFMFNGKMYYRSDEYDEQVVRALGQIENITPFGMDFPPVPPKEILIHKTSLYRIFDMIAQISGIALTLVSAGLLTFYKEDNTTFESKVEDERVKRNVATRVDSVVSNSPATGTTTTFSSRESIPSPIVNERVKRTQKNTVDTPTSIEPASNTTQTYTTRSLNYNWRSNRENVNGGSSIPFDRNSTKLYYARDSQDPDNCNYGVIFEDNFYFFGETAPNSCKWYGFTRHVNEITDLVVMTQASQTYNRAVMNGHRGKTVKADCDVSQKFAQYICFGTQCQEIDFPAILKERQGTQKQGMYDYTSRNHMNIIMENKIPIGNFEHTAQYAIMLYNRIGITNSHAGDDFNVVIGGALEKVKIIARSRNNDVLIFELLNQRIPAYPDIRKHIISAKEVETYFSSTKGHSPILVGLGPKEDKVLMMATCKSMTKYVSNPSDFGHVKYSNQIDYFGSHGVTATGDCGAPILVMNPGVQHKWIAIHNRGAADISMGAPITREYVDALIAGGKDEVEEQADEINMRYSEYIDLQVPFQDQEFAGIPVVGLAKLPVHVPTSTTKYHSGIKIDPDTEPTVKSKSDPRNFDKKNFLVEGVKRYLKVNETDFSQEEVDSAAMEVANYLVDKMNSDDLHTRVLSTTESINGTSRNEFPMSKGIDRQGAVGYPYSSLFPQKKAKQDYLYQNDDNLLWYFRNDQPSQKLLSSCSLMNYDALKGVTPQVLWMAYSKDEPVKLSKIYDLSKAKTRVFFSGPMDYQLVYRRYFSSAIWRITEMNLEVPIRVGLNPVSLQWEILAYAHLEKSDHGFDSDMENWDGTVPIEFLKVIPKIYNRIYQMTDPDWKPEHDIARTALHQVVEGAYVLLYDKVIKFDHAMISGFPGTTVDNSLINWMLFYCCWRRIMLQKDRQSCSFDTFMKNTCLSVFGDDNICTVSPQYQQFFNFNTFRETAACFGFVVTDAGKTGEKQPDQRPFEELEFLKRGFVRQGSLYLPQLTKMSLEKSLVWTTCTPPYEYTGEWRKTTRPEVYCESLTGFFREAAMYNRDKYEEFCDVVRKGLKGSGYNYTIPSYDGIRLSIGFN